MDRGALVTVTAITAAVATTLMALFTNYPIAMAPGMGINAFFTFTIVLANGVPWSEALGMVFVNGIIFLSLSVTGVREKIIASIPLGLRSPSRAAWGFSSPSSALRTAELSRETRRRLWARRLHDGTRQAVPGGIVLTALLVARKVPGSIVIGIPSA